MSKIYSVILETEKGLFIENIEASKVEDVIPTMVELFSIQEVRAFVIRESE